MCGIVGVLSLDNKSIKLGFTKSMADKIAHRGPDDAGYLYFHTGSRHKKKISFHLNLKDSKFLNTDTSLPNIDSAWAQNQLNLHDYDLFMGHRRLAILDTSFMGHQPMSDLTKNIWISYNGEIYNFKEIKSELQKLGYHFKSSTDTEVIIYSYLEWGIKCINKFNGMFAFSLYDNKKKKFFLVRDRYGIKPVYYSLTKNKTLLFASETKSILEYKDCKFNLDKETLVEYFTFQNIFTNKTLHKDINLLEAGHYLEINLTSKNIKKIKYWDFNYSQTDIIKDEREYIEELDRLFVQAVKRQLVSDVPIGSYLSGGLDSGSITSIASSQFKESNKFLKTFTIGFDLSSASGLEINFDERIKAEHMSYKFKTEHYEMVLKSGDMERCLPNFAYHLEEPRIGQSYPNYYAAKLTSKFVKVVLSGTGGDELFAGYPWRYNKIIKSKNLDDYFEKYYKTWHRLMPNVEIKKFFSPIRNEIKNVSTLEIFKNVFKKRFLPRTSEDFVNNSLYFESKTFLHGLLVVEDKLSMAHSLETRVPFLDNDLVDFAQKIPVKFKLKNLDKNFIINENELKKFTQTNSGKAIFRKTIKKYIPENIHNAVKQGFSSPDGSWFKGESINFVKSKLLNNDAKIYDYINKESVKENLQAHFLGKKNLRLLIWSLINFEEWLNAYEK